MGRPKQKKVAESTMAFRIAQTDRNRLEKAIDKKRGELNSEVSPDEYKVTKNEVIVAALMLGLERLGISDLPKRTKRKG
ncbi:MAG: hypothetical protein HRT44_08305 [Bdellovibrionales bacterium]|nr:hypothetical protein [Bdellovibrionales bacterium]NQZ19241.1 hypothetical protein [Bdellovibrionales bacterium]